MYVWMYLGSVVINFQIDTSLTAPGEAWEEVLVVALAPYDRHQYCCCSIIIVIVSTIIIIIIIITALWWRWRGDWLAFLRRAE